MVEQRIRGHLDFVELNVALIEVHPDRRRIADEVDFVPACGKLHSQLRGDHSGTAVRRITRDADFHRTAFLSLRGALRRSLPEC